MPEERRAGVGQRVETEESLLVSPMTRETRDVADTLGRSVGASRAYSTVGASTGLVAAVGVGEVKSGFVTVQRCRLPNSTVELVGEPISLTLLGCPGNGETGELLFVSNGDSDFGLPYAPLLPSSDVGREDSAELDFSPPCRLPLPLWLRL